MPVLGRSPSLAAGVPIVRKRASSDVSVTSTVMADLDTSLDIILPAVAGDTIEAELLGSWTQTGSNYGYLDVVTVVNGVVVNSCVFQAAAASGSNGSYAWLGVASVISNIAGAIRYVLQPGDIYQGTVTLRLRSRVSSAGTKTIYASATEPFVFMARNLTGSVAYDAVVVAVTKTAAYTANVGEMVLANAAGGAFTVTLPTAPIVGSIVTVKKIDATTNIVTVVGAGSTTIDGDPSGLLVSQWASVMFVYDGTNWLVRGAYGDAGTVRDPLLNLYLAANYS